MTPTSRLRAQRDQLDQAIALERATVTRLRAQLDVRRPPPPSLSIGRPMQTDLAARASLAAHQASLSQLQARRDRVVRELAAAKDRQ